MLRSSFKRFLPLPLSSPSSSLLSPRPRIQFIPYSPITTSIMSANFTAVTAQDACPREFPPPSAPPALKDEMTNNSIPFSCRPLCTSPAYPNLPESPTQAELMANANANANANTNANANAASSPKPSAPTEQSTSQAKSPLMPPETSSRVTLVL